MVTRTKLVTGAAALVSAGSLAFAGATLANADTAPTGEATAPATRQDDRGGDGPGRGFGGHEHTEVTGAEATKVTDAVTTKDSGVTVESVRKDADGSYDVMGTKSGERVMVEVSEDLATVEVRTGGPMGGPGGHGGHEGHGGPGRMTLTQASDAEKTKVVAAITAKDAAFTVEDVRKDDRGGFHVMGTKDGKRAMARVSADLTTVEVRTDDGHGPGGHAHTPVTGDEATKVTAAVTKKDSGVTVERVVKDPDGSYDVMGTKSGERVVVEVSEDLATVEVRTGGPAGGPSGGPRDGQGRDAAPSTTPSTGTAPTDVPTPAQAA